MSRFVRKNQLVFSGTFTLATGAVGTPTTANLVLSYTNTIGKLVRATVAMTNTLGVWSCTWDTSDAADGQVDWMVYGSGALIAAAQGSLDIDANPANIGTA